MAHLSLKVRITDVSAQKIDRSSVAIYGIVIAAFQVVNKLDRSRFFQESFLSTNISIQLILSMLFVIFSNADMQCVEKKLT